MTRHRGTGTLVLVSAAVIATITACSATSGRPNSGSATVGLSASSSCRTYLTAAQQVQDDAVKQIAVAQNDSVVLARSTRHKVDDACAQDDGLTLGGAIDHVARAHAVAADHSTHAPTMSPSTQVTSVKVKPAARPLPKNTATTPVDIGPAAPINSAELLAAYRSTAPADATTYSDSSGSITFTSPSQNIMCTLDPTYSDAITCMISRYDFPQQGADCNLGALVSIDSSGYVSTPECAGSALRPDASHVLGYDRSISSGELACVSSSSGISCMNLASGTGFVLSRAQYVPID